MLCSSLLDCEFLVADLFAQFADLAFGLLAVLKNSLFAFELFFFGQVFCVDFRLLQDVVSILIGTAFAQSIKEEATDQANDPGDNRNPLFHFSPQ